MTIKSDITWKYTKKNVRFSLNQSNRLLSINPFILDKDNEKQQKPNEVK